MTCRRMAGLLAVLVTLGTAGLAAQSREPSADVEMLRQQVEERFSERVRQELGLSDDQAEKLRATSREFALKRRDLFREDRRTRLALGEQMRPGTAADQDSVARLTEKIGQSRSDLSRSYQDELEAMTFLTPVQRARYFQLRERLLERVRDAQSRRQGMTPRAGRPRLRGGLR